MLAGPMLVPRRKKQIAQELERLLKTVAKTRPDMLYGQLFRVFLIFAGAGDASRVNHVLSWMYGPRIPAPKGVPSFLSTFAVDGFCAAAGLGDRTRGLPQRAPGAPPGALDQRVATAEALVHDRLAQNYANYTGHAAEDDAWRDRPPSDPRRQEDQWSRIKLAMRNGQERDALARLITYLDELAAHDRGAGHGDELILALELALRNGEAARVPAWIARHGHLFASEEFLLQCALCLPRLASAIAGGLLTETFGLSHRELETALGTLDAALETAIATTSVDKAPKVQKRRVSCEYSQLHLEPESLDNLEKRQVYFQKNGESERGMSLFPTMVGIATPTATDYVDAEISVVEGGRPDLKGAAQVVAFPFLVRGPLVLKNVVGNDDDPFLVPLGSYDVLARFTPKKAPRASAASGLRVFSLALSFHPEGALDAPNTICLDQS
jgi:hypothetical protein